MAENESNQNEVIESQSDDVEHQLYQEVRRRYKEYLTLGEDGTPVMDSQTVSRPLNSDVFKTIHCECGESFLKDETAAEHIRTEGPDSERGTDD